MVGMCLVVASAVGLERHQGIERFIAAVRKVAGFDPLG